MKRENVFENDSPTLEMETQSLRPSQQGQQIPFANGFSINPYPGATMNHASAPYQQQPGFVNYNGFVPQQIAQQYMHPGVMQNQPFHPYGSSYMQPFMQGNMAPGFVGNAFQNPYMQNQYPGSMPYQTTHHMHGQMMGTPFTQPMHAVQSNFGVINPNYPSPYLQPAINIADGQYMHVPSQPTQGTSKNGSPYSKNGERDFISWNPNVNILETDRSFKIEICVPGVTKENCHINVDKNNILRITGTRRWNQETEAVGFTRKEFNYGSFACSFLLTDNLQREKITSSCRNGLLIVSILKKDENESEDRTFSEISVN